jgi:hypothetical protein
MLTDGLQTERESRSMGHAAIGHVAKTSYFAGCARQPTGHASAMSANGTNRTCKPPWRMSAFGGKADIPDPLSQCLLMTLSGHSGSGSSREI